MLRKRNQADKDESGGQIEGVVQPPAGELVDAGGPSPPDLTREHVGPVAATDVAGPLDPEGAADADAGAGQAEVATQVDAETRSQRAFFGRSAHLAVMAELLHRRINVAIPEVDVGDDIFVVRGVNVEVTRVQVTAANAREQQNSYVALINVPEDQLSVPQDNPPLVYVFPIRHKGRWSDFVVIRRGTLFARYANEQAGKRYADPKTGKPYVQFRIVLTETTLTSGPADFQPYRDAWDPWPPPWLEDEGNAPRQAAGEGGVV